MVQHGPRMTQNDPKWPKNDPKLPKMAQNYPKWPKNDARIYALFTQFFFTEKAVPQTFIAFRMYESVITQYCHANMCIFI